VSERAQRALDELARQWSAERRTARERFAAERRGTSLARRVARGLALDELVVDEQLAAARDRIRVALAADPRIDLDLCRFGPGDPVRIGPGDHGPWVRGVFLRRDGQRIWIVADTDLPDELEDGRAVVEAEAHEITFDRGDGAIARARAARGDAARLIDVLYGEREAHVAPERTWSPLDGALDDAQRAAVDAALRADDVALIHGPPGTGKTRTLVEVVRQLVGRGRRVLCTAASNTAVDNLGERLAAAGLEPVRLGHPARVSPALEDETLDARVEADGATGLAREWRDRARALRQRAAAHRDRAARDEARALERDARRELMQTERAIVGRARVVLATCAGADHPVLGDEQFDVVVVDEATQAVDPLALVALLRAPRAILAGDPHQLPPTVIDVEAARAGLASTFFDRLAAARPPPLLVQQHRMHAAIMRFPSEQTYGGRLVAAPAVAGHTLADLGVADDPLRPGPLWLIDTAGTDWTDRRGGLVPGDDDDADPSTWNPGLAERTAAEVRRLLSRGLGADRVAVIAPYAAQVRRLRELLVAERAAGLEIATIDAFQGREKEAVVLDLVRANERGEIGFLGDLRRINVALTRARRFLLVVADSATLGAHAYYAALIAAFDAAGAHGSAWSDEAEPL
jgi:ATP-dependent RNA/DNA helicase IGHMBP2